MRWLCASVLVAGLLGPGCVAATKHEALKQEMAGLQNDLLEAEQNLARAEDYIMDLEKRGENAEQWRTQYEDAQARLAAMKDQLAQLQAQGYLPDIAGAETTYGPNGIGYSVAGDVTFAPGSADLTKRGKEILKDVATQLKKHDGRIRVDGHTDTDPINKTKDKWPLGNIQLGAGRAIAVHNYLIEQGVPEERVFIASYGPHQPRVSGKSSEAKAKNRRVEVLMVMEPNVG